MCIEKVIFNGITEMFIHIDYTKRSNEFAMSYKLLLAKKLFFISFKLFLKQNSIPTYVYLNRFDTLFYAASISIIYMQVCRSLSHSEFQILLCF